MIIEILVISVFCLIGIILLLLSVNSKGISENFLTGAAFTSIVVGIVIGISTLLERFIIGTLHFFMPSLIFVDLLLGIIATIMVSVIIMREWKWDLQ